MKFYFSSLPGKSLTVFVVAASVICVSIMLFAGTGGKVELNSDFYKTREKGTVKVESPSGYKVDSYTATRISTNITADGDKIPLRALGWSDAINDALVTVTFRPITPTTGESNITLSDNATVVALYVGSLKVKTLTASQIITISNCAALPITPGNVQFVILGNDIPSWCNAVGGPGWNFTVVMSSGYNPDSLLSGGNYNLRATYLTVSQDRNVHVGAY